LFSHEAKELRRRRQSRRAHLERWFRRAARGLERGRLRDDRGAEARRDARKGAVRSAAVASGGVPGCVALELAARQATAAAIETTATITAAKPRTRRCTGRTGEF
jgi:hypothetical protein